MNKTSHMGGVARAKALSSARRRQIARRAAAVRWGRHRAGVLQRSAIRREVTRALGDLDVSVYLFGSYARGQATPRSDVDLMVVMRKIPAGFKRLRETAELRRKITFDKPVDLILVDAESFERWKGEYGSVQHEVASEGVRLV